MSITKIRVSRRVLTFGRTVDDLVLLLGVLEDALRAEHVAVLLAVELDLLLRVLRAVLDLALGHLARRQRRVRRRRHRQPRQHLIVHPQIVR